MKTIKKYQFVQTVLRNAKKWLSITLLAFHSSTSTAGGGFLVLPAVSSPYIETTIPVKNGFTLSMLESSGGFGYSHSFELVTVNLNFHQKFKSAIITNNQFAYVDVIFQPPTLRNSADLRVMENNIGLGYNYAYTDSFAFRIYAQRDKIYIGIRKKIE